MNTTIFQHPSRQTFEYKGFTVIVHKTTVTNANLEHRECYCAVLWKWPRRKRVFADTADEAAEEARQWIDRATNSDVPSKKDFENLSNVKGITTIEITTPDGTQVVVSGSLSDGTPLPEIVVGHSESNC